MNDTELDEMLNRWTAPPAPDTLRDSVRAAFPAGQERWILARAPRAGKRMLAAAMLGAAALLLVVAQARPGAPPARIPYSVDSEFIRYADDGSPSIEMYSSSYELDGAEILRSRSIPRSPFGTAIGRALDATLPLWSRLMARVTVDGKTLERLRRRIPHTVGAISGCEASCLVLERQFFARASAGVDTACVDGKIVGRETILNYPTAAVQPHMGGSVRMTWWTAPDLGCFSLRITAEEKRADGAWRLVSEKRALRIDMKP